MPIHVPVEINFSFINQKIIFFLKTYVLLFNSCKVECCDVKQRDFETLVFKFFKNKHYCIVGLRAFVKRRLLNCIEPNWFLRTLEDFGLLSFRY